MMWQMKLVTLRNQSYNNGLAQNSQQGVRGGGFNGCKMINRCNKCGGEINAKDVALLESICKENTRTQKVVGELIYGTAEGYQHF